MTEFLFIRHGDPNYSQIDKRKYISFGNDLAPLSQEGEKRINDIAENDILKNIDLILCSPYTRTMQTAAILSRKLNIDMKVELDLMEWIPDKTYLYDDYQKVVNWREEYEKNNGKHKNKNDNWEEKNEIITRVKDVLNKYTNYNKILIVSHGMVINALTGTIKPEYGQIISYSLDTNN